MPDISPLTTALIFAAIGLVGTKYISWRRRVKNLPPGPPMLPFIDNLHNMPNGLDWVRFSELSKEYNTDILHLGALGTSTMILDTYEAAKELLEKRAGIYSDRPALTMFNMAKVDGILSLLPYGDRWRESRRMFVKYFGTGVTKVDEARELFYVRRCLKQLIDEPEDFMQHIQHLVGSIAIHITYGLEAHPKNDQNIQASALLMQRLTGIIDQGFYLVNVLPFLKHIPSWVPGAAFQKTAGECSESVGFVRDGIFARAIKKMGKGDHSPSLVSDQMQEFEDGGGLSDITILKDVASTVYIGAADTTWSTLGTFFLAMVCYPEVQKKAQEEIDNVLGGRLPEHKDLEYLPYLTAMFMEVMRWKPVLPVGFAHVSVMDDIYNGHFIPKGTSIFPNAWSMLNNPADYPNPSEFIPDRFLKDGKIDESVRNPLDIGFGFGRRICPGRHMAQSTFMITAASVLSTLDLLPKVDKMGNPIQPKQEYHLSVISHPKNFPCQIKPRTLQARQLIETSTSI